MLSGRILSGPVRGWKGGWGGRCWSRGVGLGAPLRFSRAFSGQPLLAEFRISFLAFKDGFCLLFRKYSCLPTWKKGKRKKELEKLHTKKPKEKEKKFGVLLPSCHHSSATLTHDQHGASSPSAKRPYQVRAQSRSGSFGLRPALDLFDQLGVSQEACSGQDSLPQQFERCSRRPVTAECKWSFPSLAQRQTANPGATIERR